MGVGKRERANMPVKGGRKKRISEKGGGGGKATGGGGSVCPFGHFSNLLILVNYLENLMKVLKGSCKSLNK